MRKTKVSQIDIIDSIALSDVTVVVKGKEITLTPPTEAAVRGLRRVQYSLMPKEGAEPDMEAMADAGIDLATGALRACIKGLNQERAFRLVLASGGETSELVKHALGLCGIGLPDQAESGDDLPT